MEVEPAITSLSEGPGTASIANSGGQAPEIPFLPLDRSSGNRRAPTSQTLEQIYDSLNEDQRCRKLDCVDTAQISPFTKRTQLLTNKTNIGKNYGYTVQGKIYLCPEEALYFLETQKLQILLGNIPMSIQRGRSIYLNPVNDQDGYEFKGTSCGIGEYTVFKYLAQQGYRPRRPKHILNELEKAVIQANDEEESSMETDADVAAKVVAGGGSREDSPTLGKRRHCDGSRNLGKKAKILDGTESGSGQSGESSPDVVVVGSEDKFVPETVLLDSSASSSSSLSTSSSDEPMPSTSRGYEPYTVTEVDSDVEFVEEFTPNGVLIEEIESTQNIKEEEDDDEELLDIDYNEYKTEEACSSKTALNHVLVDLVSSGDEEENSEQALKKFSATIWSQLVPNSTARLGLPPEELLPKGIIRPENPQQQTEKSCDVELEEIVDSLRLDSDSNYTHHSEDRNQAKSWLDWRNQQTAESFNVFSNSLFGSFTGESEPATIQKLNLWDTGPKAGSSKQEVQRQKFLRKHKFDLYLPTENKLARSKLEKPAYRIIIVKESELLPNLESLAYSEDQVPFLIAVINEDQDVSFLLPGDNSGIPSLFPHA